jgi:hypothetical protein
MEDGLDAGVSLGVHILFLLIRLDQSILELTRHVTALHPDTWFRNGVSALVSNSLLSVPSAHALVHARIPCFMCLKLEEASFNSRQRLW